MFLSVSNLTKSYNTGIATHVLKSVSMELQKGRIGVILGPSGSGKSTLMNIIGEVDRADGGTVEVDGTCVTNLSDDELVEYRRESVGFVFQFYNLVPNLTVAENIEVVSIIRDVTRKMIIAPITPAITGFLLGIPLMLASANALYGYLGEMINLALPMILSPLYVAVSFILIYAVYEFTKLLCGRNLAKIPMSEALKAGME